MNEDEKTYEEMTWKTLYAVEDVVENLLAEVKHSRRLLAHIARDEGITIVGFDGTRYTPDGMLYTEVDE